MGSHAMGMYGQMNLKIIQSREMGNIQCMGMMAALLRQNAAP